MGIGAEPRAAALVLRDISKNYGLHTVLNKVSLEVAESSIHALLGHNGSGKSSLIRILAGVERGEPGGLVTTQSTSVTADDITPERAETAGIVAVHQSPTLFPGISIAENLAIGRHFSTRGGIINRRAMRREAEEALAVLGILRLNVNDQVEDLLPGEKMLLCIARALSRIRGKRGILILDEPTAALQGAEVDLLHRVVRNFASQGGSVVYVSHHLDEVLDLADAVTILRDGERVLSCSTTGLSEEEIVAEMMGPASRSVVSTSGLPRAPMGGDVTPVLSLSKASTRVLTAVDLVVRAGECVGLAGRMTDGATEIVSLLSGGGSELLAGEVRLCGSHYAPRSAAAAVEAGVAHVPSDRGSDAVFPDLSVAENILAGQLASCSKWGWIRWTRVERSAADAIASYGIRCRSTSQIVTTLSGGNQQRSIVARAIRSQPKVLLLSDPTQGVDIGARREIHDTVRRACADGMAVVLSSSDSKELCELSDRIIVLRKGSPVRVLSGEDRSEHKLVAAIYGTGEAA